MNSKEGSSLKQSIESEPPSAGTQFKDSNLPRPFLAWPGGELLRYFVLLGLAQTIWFFVIYGGTDYITSLRTHRVRIHFEEELGIPFYPSMVMVYMSIYILFFLSPFVLRTYRELRALAITFATVTFIAGICFLLLPTEVAFPQPTQLGPWAQLFHFADWINLDHNLLPSLHVGLAVVSVGAFATRASILGKLALWSWAVAVGVSTVLTHQHHLVDVPAGFLLGIAGAKLVYKRLSVPKDNSVLRN